MKRKTKHRVFIVFAFLIIAALYGRYNFTGDRDKFVSIITIAGDGNVPALLAKMKEPQHIKNPLIKIAYWRFKSKIEARFINQEETFPNISSNKIIHDISIFYQNYWRSELLKTNLEERNDSILYQKLSTYILDNNLTELSKDSLIKNIADDSELERIIQEEGFQCKTFYLNGLQDIMIWKDERTKKVQVELPNQNIEANVIFLDEFILTGYANFASFGHSQTGGWAEKEDATLYCNSSGSTFNENSEEHQVSLLKHESIHFLDLNKYPNLSSTDLEYRAKLVELIYCTEATIYDRIGGFLNGASSEIRTHSHPYADYSIIKNFSKVIFNSEFESDFSKWKSIETKEINKVARELFQKSQDELAKDKKVKNII